MCSEETLKFQLYIVNHTICDIIKRVINVQQSNIENFDFLFLLLQNRIQYNSWEFDCSLQYSSRNDLYLSRLVELNTFSWPILLLCQNLLETFFAFPFTYWEWDTEICKYLKAIKYSISMSLQHFKRIRNN